MSSLNNNSKLNKEVYRSGWSQNYNPPSVDINKKASSQDGNNCKDEPISSSRNITQPQFLFPSDGNDKDQQYNVAYHSIQQTNLNDVNSYSETVETHCEEIYTTNSSVYPETSYQTLSCPCLPNKSLPGKTPFPQIQPVFTFTQNSNNDYTEKKLLDNENKECVSEESDESIDTFYTNQIKDILKQDWLSDEEKNLLSKQYILNKDIINEKLRESIENSDYKYLVDYLDEYLSQSNNTINNSDSDPVSMSNESPVNNSNIIVENVVEENSKISENLPLIPPKPQYVDVSSNPPIIPPKPINIQTSPQVTYSTKPIPAIPVYSSSPNSIVPVDAHNPFMSSQYDTETYKYPNQSIQTTTSHSQVQYKNTRSNIQSSPSYSYTSSQTMYQTKTSNQPYYTNTNGLSTQHNKNQSVSMNQMQVYTPSNKDMRSVYNNEGILLVETLNFKTQVPDLFIYQNHLCGIIDKYTSNLRILGKWKTCFFLLDRNRLKLYSSFRDFCQNGSIEKCYILNMNDKIKDLCYTHDNNETRCSFSIMEPVSSSLYTGIHIPFISLGIATPLKVSLTLGSRNEKVVIALRNELVQLLGCQV